MADGWRDAVSTAYWSICRRLRAAKAQDHADEEERTAI
ncbi:hypothetical protein SS05631_c00910 [Sinorhizobium sp. CCBAU 05631]|nr:hypothetical protein SS05631_c00910 [Sinorhizobium sp. CCBAU 05631]